jgi:hypothetical protein
LANIKQNKRNKRQQQKLSTLRYIIFQLQKIKDKEKIFKENGGKNTLFIEEQR